MMQTLFSAEYGIFQDDSAYIHEAGLVLSWIEDEVQHLPCPPPDLNVIESLWSNLEL